MYKIKEIYPTIQCEGFHSGRAAIFCRFTGCNLWSGREADRESAICSFCDTEFVGMDGQHGGKYTVDELSAMIDTLWEGGDANKFVVFTGGEPLLQLDENLVDAMHDKGFEIAVETNGTLAVPKGVDWITCSPKANTQLAINYANELKIVFPQDGLSPADFSDFDADHFYLQAMDSDLRDIHTKQTIQYCMKNPKWLLSVQTHKYLGIL